ncbi:hypothetical protein [Mucilaginibacter paludis]|uniref:Mucin-like protein n=1 Tax=Mucilaginibacter paludis DSM 18603 TaxID=714943 RepID=H1YC51_9SPHI|nr:hypothetical protein [Mucilaginibacter paludis]EHQ29614.1 mucin-like protein [Mucilaginibacter paludis DSM 18603]
MKKNYTSQFISLLAIAVLALSSCEKIPGHTVAPSTSTSTSTSNGGSGGTFSLGSGTVTFQIDNGTTYTWTSPAYLTSFGTTIVPGSSTRSTLITAAPKDVNLALTTSFDLSFSGTTPGTYPMNGWGAGVNLPNLTLTAAGGSEVVKVTTASITLTSALYGTAKGTVRGTFDGKMYNTTTYDSVRVSGSFNITQ